MSANSKAKSLRKRSLARQRDYVNHSNNTHGLGLAAALGKVRTILEGYCEEFPSCAPEAEVAWRGLLKNLAETFPSVWRPSERKRVLLCDYVGTYHEAGEVRDDREGPSEVGDWEIVDPRGAVVIRLRDQIWRKSRRGRR